MTICMESNKFLCREGFEVTYCPLEEGHKNGPCEYEDLCESMQAQRNNEAPASQKEEEQCSDLTEYL